MTDQNAALMYEAVAREVERTSYPEAFPAIPELPAGRYFEPEFYALELQYLWTKTWISVAHVSELPEAGSYQLFEQFGQSIIISRGLDNEIRAFRNVCRHRGAPIVTEQKGKVRRFICPYHAWGYDLEGQLTSVPEAYNFACLNKSERPLTQVRCETWQGHVFINMDDAAEPLARFMAPITRQVADFPLADMVVKDTISVEMDCNWKTAYDNFLEIYHVNTIHAKSLAPYFDSKSFNISLLKNGHARFATRRKKTGKTFFSDGKAAGPKDFTARFQEYTVGLPVFPNIFTALDPIGFSWQRFLPAGPGKSIMQAVLMGWKKDDAADRKFWADMRVSQISVLNEDLFLFAGIQRSMASGDLRKILLGYQERQIYWYHEEIDRRIGAQNIPAHLRVQQVLGAQMSD